MAQDVVTFSVQIQEALLRQFDRRLAKTHTPRAVGLRDLMDQAVKGQARFSWEKGLPKKMTNQESD